MKNNKLLAILLSVLLCVSACGDSSRTIKTKVAYMSMSFGYQCAKEGKTLKECENELTEAIINAL